MLVSIMKNFTVTFRSSSSRTAVSKSLQNPDELLPSLFTAICGQWRLNGEGADCRAQFLGHLNFLGLERSIELFQISRTNDWRGNGRTSPNLGHGQSRRIVAILEGEVRKFFGCSYIQRSS